MGLTKTRSIIFYLLIVHCSLFSLLPAQSFGPAGSLSEEIQRLEIIIQDTKIDGAAKKSALIEKAQLFEITGNIEEAAKTWNEAAFAESNKRDDNALFRCAACFAAMGDYSRADAHLKTILLTGNNAKSLKDAKYLSAQIEVLRKGENGFPVLLAFLENPDYNSFQPEIYYLLWKVSGSEKYKSTLIADFPESPEALLAQENNSAISPAFTPMWLLFPGREQLVFSAPITETTHPANQPSVKNENETESESPVLLQAGLYSKQENAQAMVNRLKSKGFTGTISTKAVSGTMYWQVTLLPGTDSNRTIMQLKDAGFETFPVFTE
jgi:tetratricopeptide (TPR) repeat protein